jgi:predicted RNase H-like nuclease (RuvC/YqgF family)
LDPETVKIIIALVSGGGLAGVLTAWFTKRKLSAEGRNLEVRGELQIVEAAQGLIGTSQDMLVALRADVDRLLKRIRELETGMTSLGDENRKLRVRCDALESENDRLVRALEKRIDGA